VRLIGVDPAWKPENNGSAVAVGRLNGAMLEVEHIHGALFGLSRIAATILAAEPHGIAIDGPLIIENQTGRRACEKALSKVYASKHAGCHTTNRTLYPDAAVVALSRQLEHAGYRHLGAAHTDRFQIEMYPHPALIEMFDLPHRLLYKKGNVDSKRGGQVVLASLLRRLERSSVLELKVPVAFDAFLQPSTIMQLRGDALKANEDALDSLICLYVCGLYAIGASMRLFGDALDGYVVVPATRAI
jgi:predicted RNase H-like nuclease